MKLGCFSWYILTSHLVKFFGQQVAEMAIHIFRKAYMSVWMVLVTLVTLNDFDNDC